MKVLGGRRAYARPPLPGLHVVRREDLPALVGARLRALLLRPALPLAAVLGLAGVVGAGAASLALALVHAGALHDLGAFLLLRGGLLSGQRGAGCEEGTDGG